MMRRATEAWRKFDAFDNTNPEVYRLFQTFTFQMIGRGFSQYSSDAVLHRVRWETATPLKEQAAFRINNNWSPFYARKFAADWPKHANFFEQRPSLADVEDEAA